MTDQRSTGTAAVHALPQACPVCGGRLLVTASECDACGSGVTGRFRSDVPDAALGSAAVGPLAQLRPDQADVVLTLVAARGDLREAARRLGTDEAGLSASLDDVTGALGLAPADGRPGVRGADDLLARVQRGEVSPEDAARVLDPTSTAPSHAAPGGTTADDRDAREAEILRRVEAGELDPLEGARLIAALY